MENRACRNRFPRRKHPALEKSRMGKTPHGARQIVACMMLFRNEFSKIESDRPNNLLP
jgi:hypothetical protein